MRRRHRELLQRFSKAADRRTPHSAIHNLHSPARMIGLVVAVWLLALPANPATGKSSRLAGTANGEEANPALLDAIPTLRVFTSGAAGHWDASTPTHTRRGAGDCPGPITESHTDADFGGGSYVIQAGFAENEIAAVSFVLDPGDFPISITTVECIFAQQDAIEETVTQWSILIWDGLPSTGILVAEYSSDDVILPHLILPPGTSGANVQVNIDPGDPIYVVNESGTNTFSVGYRVDQHNYQTQNPCYFPPQSNRNAFPTTDVSGLLSPMGNWLWALDCGPLGCPAGWHPFAELGLCQPSGDWVMRATFTCTPSGEEGACCDLAQQCFDDMDGAACEQLGWPFMGPGTTCSEVTCPEPAGACCLGETCLSDVPPSTCDDIQGIYVGDWTSCDDNPCEPGACCLPDGSCQGLIAAECESAGGTFQGIGTDCGSVECPQPTGSCCIGTICISGQTQETCEQVGTFNGAGSTCDPDPCAGQDCGGRTIIDAQPPTGTIDARQPHPVDDDSAEARQGIGGNLEPITITLSASGVSPECFSLCETGVDPQLGPNSIVSVNEIPEPGTYEIVLARPITAGAVTTIAYDDGSFVAYTSHPANADGGSSATPAGILSVIDFLNGVADPPFGIYSADINHSGILDAADILTLIDLLNGADRFDPWNATILPENIGCP